MGVSALLEVGHSGFGNLADLTLATIASASTISPTDLIMRVTGNTNIDTITPILGFNGPLTLFNTDATVGGWTTNGNIAVAGTFTRFRTFTFVFDPVAVKWYPSNTA